MKVDPKPSKRYGEYVRKIGCDQWESIGQSGADKGVIRHKATGQTAAYNLHDGGNDWNGPRNFALLVQRVCGCQLIQPRGRKRSRKNPLTEVIDLTARRERHAAQHADRLDREAAARAKALADEKARTTAAAQAAASDKHLHEIEALMRPGRGL